MMLPKILGRMDSRQFFWVAPKILADPCSRQLHNVLELSCNLQFKNGTTIDIMQNTLLHHGTIVLRKTPVKNHWARRFSVPSEKIIKTSI